MTDAHSHSSPKLRVVVLADTDQPSARKTTHNLLDQLGMDVSPADTTADALRDSAARSTDLLLLDLPEPEEQRRVIEDLIALPPARRPRHVAIMSERINDDLIALRRSMNQTKLHLFVKPLHLHGLLGVIKKMESNALTTAH